ncbi:MAG: hypothetical protein WCJ84_01945 [Candidatus Peregrinibacteria bacterium]
MNQFLQTIESFFGTFLHEIRPLFDNAVDKSDEFFLSLFLLIFGWWLGAIVEGIIVKIGDRPFLQHLAKRSGFSDLLKKAEIHESPALVIGQFLKGYIFSLFILSVANILGITAIAEFLESIIRYIPNIVVALIIVLFGVQVGDTTAAVIKSGFKVAKSSSGKILALVAEGIIVTFSILAALSQLKIAEDLVRVLFIGFVGMIAISGGLAFGLGGKKIVEEFLDDLRDAKGEKEEEK